MGIGAKDGVASAFHTIAALARASPDRFVVRLDIETAHQSFSRSQALAEIVDKCPALSLPYSVWCGKQRGHLWRSSDGRASYIPSQRGGDQGDAIVQQAFVLVLAPRVKEAIERIKQIDAKAQLLQYADDMQLWIDGTSIDRALAILGEELEKVDLTIADRKTKIWSQNGSSRLPAHLGRLRVNAMECLGSKLMTTTDPSEPAAPAHGSQRSALEKAARKVDEFANQAGQLHKHGLPLQISQVLLRYVAVGACQHALEV